MVTAPNLRFLSFLHQSPFQNYGADPLERTRIILPLLILQGCADRLVPPSGAQMLHDRVASADKKIILYQGLYHEVFNEPERDQVLRDVEIWLDAHRSPDQPFPPGKPETETGKSFAHHTQLHQPFYHGNMGSPC